MIWFKNNNVGYTSANQIIKFKNVIGAAIELAIVPTIGIVMQKTIMCKGVILICTIKQAIMYLRMFMMLPIYQLVL